MEKSNSFKRVLAGTLALLTVASSVPAEAGSVIGDFFGTALTAKAADSESPTKTVTTARTVAVTNLNLSTGTAKVSIGGGNAVDATVTVENSSFDNIKKLTITPAEGNPFTAGANYVTVDGYTVIDDVETVTTAQAEVEAAYNATATTTALTVRVNKFTSITANGTTEYEYDGTAKEIKYGKHIADEAALDTDGNNTVEVAYIDADGNYQVLTEDEIKNNQLFDYYFDDANKETKLTSLAGCATANVKRKEADITSTVVPHVITLVGKGKYEGLVVDTNLLITPLDITNSVTVTPDQENMGVVGNSAPKFTIPHVTYDRDPAGNGDILESVKVKDKADADEHPIYERVSYTLSYEGREDTEAGQTGVLTDADGKINDNATLNVNAVNVGLYTATLNFGGNYTGTAKQSFRIMPAELTADQIKGKTAAYDDKKTVILNPVKEIKGASADDKKFTDEDNETLDGAVKVYDRTSDCAVVKAQGDADEFGLTLTTYKAEGTNADGTTKWSAAPVTDFSNVGTYKTVVTVSGNYKVAEADKNNEANIVWDVVPYDFGQDDADTEDYEYADHRFVDNALAEDGTHPWVGFVVNPATGNIEAAFNLRDNIETDLAAQAGALLNLGTDFTVEYRKHDDEDDDGEFKATLPTGLTDEDKIDVKFTGIGNYAGTSVVAEKVPISAYTLKPGDTRLNKKVGDLEQVKYQYGDEIKATVQGVPSVLTQESMYVKVQLDQNGAPTGDAYDDLVDAVKAINEEKNPTTKKNLITDLYKDAGTLSANVDADETANAGYVVVVFVNRDGGNAPTNEVDNPDYNAGYKSFFDSAVGISKGITVSRREITDSSVVEIEYVNPLLQYKGEQYTDEQLEKNIKSIKVDGIPLTAVAEPGEGEPELDDGNFAGNFVEFKVESTKTGDAAAADFTDVDNYTMKLNFTNGDNDDIFIGEANNNFKGSYTTKLATQKFSIVASQLTAADFTVNGAAIQAVYTKDGADDYVVDATTVVNTTDEKINTGTEETPVMKDNKYYGYKLAYYKAKQDVERTGVADVHNDAVTAGGKIIYDGKEWNAGVTPVTYGRKDNGQYIDFEVTGDKQTEAGPYEITISGIKNTKGSVTVKWSVDGNTFDGFTATPDKTAFDYNGEGQAPKFTLVKAATDTTPAVTLTEGKDFAVEYYDKTGTTQLDGKPVSVGTYTAKIVGIGAYYGAKYTEKDNQGTASVKAFEFTISPASDLDVTITAKEGADFSYNGEALINRVNDLFDVKVAGKKLEDDANNFIYKIVVDDNAGKTDAKNAKNVGKYKISVTVYDDNYQPKTSDQTAFEITPKEITLSNITANVKTAVYGAPVAQINDSITFDYDGVIDADKDKVSVADFRGFVVVSDNYRSGSPAGEYTLVYNGNFVPVSEAAQNYKAKKFTSNEKITVAKKDLADAKPYVSLVVVPSSFANTDPDYVAKGQELKAEKIIYNGEPYEVYIQDNDNGLMTMADLKLTGTPKALHAGSDFEVVAAASANGNYTGTATLSLAWAVNQCEIGDNVVVSIGNKTGVTAIAQSGGLENKATTALTLPTDGKTALFGTAADVAAGKAAYCINTTVKVTTYTYNKDAAANTSPYTPNQNVAASEAKGDFTVYFTQLDDKGQPIEDTKTSGYPTTGGKYRAEVEFSKDFKLVNTTAPSEDPDFVPQLAQVGYVDFTVKGTPVNSAIYDLNQLEDDADLTLSKTPGDYDFYAVKNNAYDKTADGNLDNKATAFSRVYGDAIAPDFQIDVYGGNTGTDLVTAKVDVTKMRKFVEDKNGAYTIGNKQYSLSDAVYDGTAGYYDLEGAVVMNNTDYSCDFQNVAGFTKTTAGTLVYQVKRSTDYTIQFDHENNVFALKNGKAVAGYQVVDDNSGKVMTEGVDYTLKGSNEVYKTGTYTLFVEGIGNYADTVHADWVVVNGDTSVGAKFYAGNTVSFKDQVEFNFFADIDENYVDGAYVVFTYDHYGTKTEVKKMISKTDTLKDTNGTHYRVRLPLTASEMAIDVKAELFLKNAAKASDTKTRSIKDYAEAAISKNMDGANVLKAMLNYGGYTQVALGNNTSVLANASADIKEDVSAIQPKSQSTFVRPTPYEGTTTVQNEIEGIPQSVKIKFTPKVTYKGTTVMTKSMLYVRHYFTVDPSVTEDELKQIKVSTWFNNYDLVDLPKNSTGYYLDVPAEMAYNLDKDRGTVTVYGFPGSVTNAESYTGDNGSIVAAGSKTYKVGCKAGNTDFGENYAVENSANSIYAIKVNNYNVVDYCEAIANNAKQTTAAKNMVKALYKYYQAAEAYVAKRS